MCPVSPLSSPPPELDVSAFGVRLQVAVTPPRLAPAVAAALPPGAQTVDEIDDEPAAVRFGVQGMGQGIWRVSRGERELAPPLDADIAVRLLEERLADELVSHVSDLVFVRAGAVSVRGRAIVMPGGLLSGRTTLVDALVREGAELLSDSFAVIDEDGLVHPYRAAEPDAPEAEPLPIGLIALAPYRPDAVWAPERSGAAQGALALFEHVAAKLDPSLLLRWLGQAAEGAETLRGERGEAGPTAAALLAEAGW